METHLTQDQRKQYEEAAKTKIKDIRQGKVR